ncbi:MFS transporter [Arthrobacter sp. H14-L1]|uniref:MFS transporter n=1 Tax=Arthrobacter sp. H14-L1 TaxID=2996697 RepID=UPI00226D8F43|nr:MFS transporter [Arthrobacter sp. H14-L1]MCY0905026.1 MFS transporter [Arthrobacter sp. H14-L1]
MPSHSAKTTTRRPTGLIVVILCLSGTVVSLQQTMVIPLLPDFPKILNTSPDDVSWLVTVTLLTSAVATPIVSRLADMVGKRRMMIVAMVLMVIGSVIAASGGNFVTLVTGRAFQGFAASLIPVGISIMRDELPKEKVASAVALMSATLGIGSALGLPLSGIIYEALGWQAIFWLSAAVGIALIIAVLAIVPESELRTRGRFDFLGAAMLSIALTALLLAISKGGSWGWSSEPVILLFITTAVVLAVWFPFELRVSQPMVDLRTSARRPVLLTNIASILVGFSMYANMLSTTQQLQMPKVSGYGFELSVVVAGLCMVPSGLAMVALAPISAVITKRFGAKTTLIVGALVLAVSYVARVFLNSEIWMIVVGAMAVSMGTAIAYAAMPTLIMRSVPITETASANGLNSLLRAVGTSTASAAVAAILTSVVMDHNGVSLPTLDAFQFIFWLAAVAALLSVGVTAFIPKFLTMAVGKVADGRAAGSAVGLPGPAPAGAVPVPAAAQSATAQSATAQSATALAFTKLPGRAASGTALPGTLKSTADDAAAKTTGSDAEIVVSGTVVGVEGRPIRNAVVNILSTDGAPVDWSRANNDGGYSVVLPGPDRYLVVSSADGWAPHSQALNFTDAASWQQIVLSRRLTLAGMVSGAQAPGDAALVTLTRPTGEFIASTHTRDGKYELPLPPTGRYILSTLDAQGETARARQITVAGQSAVVDFAAPLNAGVLT